MTVLRFPPEKCSNSPLRSQTFLKSLFNPCNADFDYASPCELPNPLFHPPPLFPFLTQSGPIWVDPLLPSFFWPGSDFCDLWPASFFLPPTSFFSLPPSSLLVWKTTVPPQLSTRYLWGVSSTPSPPVFCPHGLLAFLSTMCSPVFFFSVVRESLTGHCFLVPFCIPLFASAQYTHFQRLPFPILFNFCAPPGISTSIFTFFSFLR